MAHAPLSKLMCKPVNTSKMCPSDFTSTLSDVLQSEPVKRLLNQPNIVIKTVPLKVNSSSTLDSSNDALMNKTNNTDSNSSKAKQSGLSVIPLKTSEEERVDDENLLPSKKQGKSEITLVPIKREKKPCGHYEPCENIVCDVAVQQYVDREGSSPMLAVNIDENEINAPVSKHCANETCDALSIDHDRCRRAVIRLNRCNLSLACDICGITLKTQRSRIHHRNCTRKNEYRHNKTNSAEILRERMREREIQMIEASKVRKNDYTDPTIGYSLAMEMLRNNEELIVIPKAVSSQQQQQPTVTISSVSATQHTTQISNLNNVFGKFLPNIPIVLPQQSMMVGKTQSSNENNLSTPIQLALPDSLTRSLITTPSTASLPQNQYVTFATQNSTHTIPLNELVLTQSQIMTTPIQPKPLITPIRVVPITNLITEPSLLHQTQGIPKFCIMPDNTSPLLTLTSPQQSVQRSAPVPKLQIASDSKSSSPKKRKIMTKKKKKFKKKEFKCDYCLKSFSTDWYFKVHVARHTGEKRYPCKMCTQSFNSRSDLKKHVSDDHESEGIASGTCDQQTSEDSQAKINNLDLQQEARKEDKTNGYGCMPTQDTVKNNKTEVCHEV